MRLLGGIVLLTGLSAIQVFAAGQAENHTIKQLGGLASPFQICDGEPLPLFQQGIGRDPRQESCQLKPVSVSLNQVTQVSVGMR